VGKAFGKRFGSASGPNRGFKTIGLSTLSSEQRSRLKPYQFAIPEKAPGPGSYPINDKRHARNALARVAQHGTPKTQARVRAAVHRKYPGIGFDPRFGRPDTKRGLQHHSLGDKVYGFDERTLYVARYRNERTGMIVKSDPIVADSEKEARRIMERQLYPHENVVSVYKIHPPGCNCPFHGGHPGRKGGIGYDLKGIGGKDFPTARRATI
jgi:hypothetical protein